MKLVVGYLATPGGADAMALGARLARTLGAEVEACIIMPPDRTLIRTSTEDYEAKLTEQGTSGSARRSRRLPTMSRRTAMWHSTTLSPTG
jgi:hypothetical protein